MDKDTLLGQMSASYERVEAALARLTPERLAAPARAGAENAAKNDAEGASDWTLKDTLAHLTFWLAQLDDLASAALNDTKPKQPHAELTDAEVDDLNTQAYQLHRDESPQQALGAFRMTYGQLADRVRLLAWDDLAAVGRFNWLAANTPLWRVIAEDSWEHFDQHLPQFEQAADDDDGDSDNGGRGRPS